MPYSLLHSRVDEAPSERRVLELQPARKRRIGFPDDKRRPRHALHPAGDDEGHLAAGDGARTLDDGIEARSAQAVHGRSRYFLGQAGEKQSHPPDVPVVLSRLVRAPVDDVVYSRHVEAGVALLERGDRESREVVGADGRQGAAIAAKWGADGVADVDGVHGVSGHGLDISPD